MNAAVGRRITLIDYFLALLLCACIARLWLMAMPSSFWVDELVTVFVIRYPGHASFAAAPQVPQSIYYALAGLSQRLFGNSEAALRLPSAIAMGAGLFFIARIAVRLVHPLAGWFAVFACLAFRPFDYFAVDARPYGLGIAVAGASLLFLIRWFDNAHWLDEAVFVLFAAALWRVHLFYWPFYLLYVLYAAIRVLRKDTPVGTGQILAATAMLAFALAPVALTAIRISRQARSHSFSPLPKFRDLFYLTHCLAVLCYGGAAWVLARLMHWDKVARPGKGALVFIGGWWLTCPFALFLYSRVTGYGVLVPRYASLMLPGLALAATAAAALFIPASRWKQCALFLGVGALAFAGDWKAFWPVHETGGWREAAAFERSVANVETPIICPSPFIEAHPPVWSPQYKLPGFLYSHLQYYTLNGRLKLFPFEKSPQSESYLTGLFGGDLLPSGRFVLYGSTWALRPLEQWFSGRPELAHWHKNLKVVGDLSVIAYQAP